MDFYLFHPLSFIIVDYLGSIIHTLPEHENRLQAEK